jgi:hypothetical protein
MRNLKFKSNSYADRVAVIDAPKSVWQALAFSLAMRICEDNSDRAVAEVEEEWRLLHAQGIVSQKPRKTEKVDA